MLFAVAILAQSESAFGQQIDPPKTPAFARDNSSAGELERDLTNIFNDPRFSNATWGVSVQSVDNGEFLFRLNDGKSLNPASNFKLLPAAEALSLLGSDFRYVTELVSTGRITSDGTLRGDLVIRGSGDPALGSAMMSKDTMLASIFDSWADSLAHRGVRRIDGSVVGYDGYFTPEYYPSGWEVEDLPYYFAMQSAGLVFNEDQVSVTVTPGESKGSAALYELNPSTDYVEVENLGTTKADSITLKRHKESDSVIAAGTPSIDITRELGSNTISIKGEIPLHGAAVNQQLSVEDPTLFAATLLHEALGEHGIAVLSDVRTSRGWTKPYPFLKARVLASYTSPPLSKIVRAMNKQSDNLIAEQLFRTVAKEIGGEGSWTKGAEVMKNFLASVEVDTSKIAIADGSGLSRMDLISAGQITKLLSAMRTQPKLFTPFYESLPVMGVDGTLETRLKSTAAEGNVHAKTGFLTGVRSISGYLTTRDGEMLAFSIIGNNFTTPVREASNLQDLVLLRLVNFSRK